MCTAELQNGADLRKSRAKISQAHSCFFRGNLGPRLVRDQGGRRGMDPVTIAKFLAFLWAGVTTAEPRDLLKGKILNTYKF